MDLPRPVADEVELFKVFLDRPVTVTKDGMWYHLNVSSERVDLDAEVRVAARSGRLLQGRHYLTIDDVWVSARGPWATRRVFADPDSPLADDEWLPDADVRDAPSIVRKRFIEAKLTRIGHAERQWMIGRDFKDVPEFGDVGFRFLYYQRFGQWFEECGRIFVDGKDATTIMVGELGRELMKAIEKMRQEGDATPAGSGPAAGQAPAAASNAVTTRRATVIRV